MKTNQQISITNLRLRPTSARTAFTLLALTLAGIALTPRAFAQASAYPPDRMAYQGYLVDATGTALATNAPKNYDVIFRIWNDPVATAVGNRLWTEQQTVTVDKGSFSVVLGEGASIGEARPGLSTVFTNSTASDRWIAITVKGIGPAGADSNILPRLRLLASPYSFLASKAMIVDGAAVTTGTVPDARLSSNVALRVGGNTFSGDQVLNNNLGIGTGSPAFPISFASTAGDKISLYGQSGNSLGFGVQANLLQIHSDATNSDIAFGSGSSAAMTETMRITGAGNVGIGTAAPTNKLQVAGNVSANAFVGDGTIPVGGIIMWSGAIAAIPSGWALCNGQTANGQVTPNLTDRFIMGAGGTYPVANTGGASSVTLTPAQMPSHVHSFNDGYFMDAITPVVGQALTGFTAYTGAYVTPGSTDVSQAAQVNYMCYRTQTTVSAGSSQAFDNRPPWYALAYIMRVR